MTAEPVLYEGDDGWWIAIAPPGALHLLMAAGKTKQEARDVWLDAHERWMSRRNGHAD